MDSYTQVAAQYCRDVVSGTIPACNFVKQACQRQIDDLARKWNYTFDTGLANAVCEFIETLPHVKDFFRSKDAGKLIHLEPWQVFILTTAFGWVDAAGNRRFRVVYIEVPRKNAKTTISAGVGLYCLVADNEMGAEVVTAATKTQQARITLDIARMMVKKRPEMAEFFGIEAREHVILRAGDGAHFMALSKDNQGSQDGQNIHCGLIDELHAHKTRDMYAALDTGTGSRSQPLIWAITTAGSNRSGICYEQRTYIKKVLDGVQTDDRTFGIIYTIDDGDKWDDETAWRKANPNYGISVNPDDIRRKCTKAIASASSQNEFLTKHLNVWVNADTAWMNMQAWDKCADPSLKIEQFHGEPCISSYDLASKIDFAANAKLFKRDAKYYLFTRFYLPEETIEQEDNSQYQGWSRAGLIEATDGQTIDFDRIETDLLDDCGNFQIESVPYDPFQATEFSQRMLAQGVPMVEYRPTVLNFSEPMKQFEALVLDGKLVHDGNPIMSWMVSNVVCKRDHKDNIYPRKEFPENKIDGPVAAFMALGVQLQRELTGGSYLDSHEVLYIE